MKPPQYEPITTLGKFRFLDPLGGRGKGLGSRFRA